MVLTVRTEGWSRMTKCTRTPRAQQIWALFAFIAVGSTIAALLATTPAGAGATVGCAANTDCGCTIPEDNPGCDMSPESGFCTGNTDSPGSCVCNTGFGGVFCCPGSGCSGEGNCVSGGSCQCFAPFTGTDCAEVAPTDT